MRRNGLLLAGATAFGLLLMSGVPAGAQTVGETSGATGIVATGPLLTIPPTPNASCGTPQNLSLAAVGSGSVTAPPESTNTSTSAAGRLRARMCWLTVLVALVTSGL